MSEFNIQNNRKGGSRKAVCQIYSQEAYVTASLKIGERVVVPFAGIARVSEIITKRFDFSEGEFYVLAPELMPDSKVFVAKGSFDSRKLRRPLNKKEAKEVFQILKNGSTKKKFASNGQHAYYEKLIKLIKNDGPQGLALIVRHFYDIDQKSMLNTKHIRKLVKFAFVELIAEVAAAYEVSTSEAEKLIDQAIQAKRPKNWKPIGRRLEQMMITDTTE